MVNPAAPVLTLIPAIRRKPPTFWYRFQKPLAVSGALFSRISPNILRAHGARDLMSVDATALHSSFFNRHEKLALVLVNVAFLALLLAVGEIAARLSTKYEIGYYTEAKVGRDGYLRYPWGVIPVNSHGYLDEKFELSGTKPRVGWFGDSVAMGLGAGYPYRISDIARDRLRGLDTWNFSRLGTGFEGPVAEEAAQKFKLNYV